MISFLLRRRATAKITVLLLGVLIGLLGREFIRTTRGEERARTPDDRRASPPRQGRTWPRTPPPPMTPTGTAPIRSTSRSVMFSSPCPT